MKLCECGCAQPAPIAKKSDGKYRKGEAKRFVLGHCGRENLKLGPPAQTHPIRHGGSRRSGPLPEYGIYCGAKTRCIDPNRDAYPDYGGRGIEFRFASFEEFMATLGPRPTPEHSVDRINNDGHYEPGNVRWATAKEQRANRRDSRRSDDYTIVAAA